MAREESRPSANYTPNMLLHTARLERGWSQSDLAEKIGSSPRTVLRWESGKAVPSSYARQKLSELFGKTMEELGLIPPSTENSSEEDNSLLRYSPNTLLRQERQARGWSQRKVAEMIGTAISAVGSWENGHSFPSLYYRQKLCDLFGKTMEELGLNPPSTKISSLSEENKSSLRYPPNIHLIEARIARGWSQEDLADKIGITFVAVSRWENGYTFPTPYFRQKLAELFGKSIEELGLIPPSKKDPSIPLPKIFNVPISRNPFFVGRNDLLTQLDAQLATGGKAGLVQQTQILSGLGGIGKTQVAAEYAYRYGEHYSHVLWLNASSRETLVADLLALADLLNLPESEQDNPQKMLAAVKRFLAETEGWLLILDSADDLPMVREFLPRKHEGVVLFTSRAQVAGIIATSIEVEVLNQEDAILMLLLYSKKLAIGEPLDQAKEADRSWAARIAEALGYLPLALAQAGSYIDETGSSLEEYLQFYQKYSHELLARRDYLMLNYPATIATTWSLSFQQVERQSLVASDLLRLSAFLASDAISESLLLRGAVLLDHFSEAEAQDTFKLNEALEVLRRYSLLHRDAETRLFRIHPLVQVVLRESMEPEDRRQWAEHTVRIVSVPFLKNDDNIGARQQYTLALSLDRFRQEKALLRDIPHVQECATLIREHRLSSSEAARLLYRAGCILKDNGFYIQAETLQQQALTLHEQVFGPEHLATAECLNMLGLLAYNRGDGEQAEKFHRRALTIHQKALGPEHLAIADSLNNLGVLYRYQQKYEEAEVLLQQALRIKEQSLGPDHLDILMSCYNLASLYVEQQQYEQAEQLLSQLLATGKRVLETAHPLIAMALHLLAKLSYTQKEYEQAETLWLRSISLLEETLGPEHPSVASYMKDLVELYAAQGRLSLAEDYCKRAISIAEKRLGPEHIDTLVYRKLLNNLVPLPFSEGVSQSKEQSLQEQLITYEVLFMSTPNPALVAEKLEAAIYLRQIDSLIENADEYQFQMSRYEAMNSELNIFLIAPGFRFDGNNIVSFPLGNFPDDLSSSLVGSQVARFQLIPLHPGTARLTVELYRGSTFETTLRKEVQVTPLPTSEVPQTPFAAHPRPILYPDFLLQVGNEWNGTDAAYRFHCTLNSLRSSLLPVGGIDCYSAPLAFDWIKQAQRLLQDILKDIANCLPSDTHSRLVTFGKYLFQYILPAELQQEIRHLVRLKQPLTLLILAPQDSWIHWELLHDGELFLGERFIIGRWLQELSQNCPYEFPMGAATIAYYETVQPSTIELWTSLLQPPGSPSPRILPGGFFENLGVVEDLKGLYLVRFGQSSDEPYFNDAPVPYSGENKMNPIEQELRPAKLNVRQNRPLVNLGYIHNGRSELTAFEQTWAPAFIHTGCSAFVGPLWTVDRTVETAFISGFYQHLWAGDSLGEALKAGRLLAKLAVPESLDYLAYVLYGDPMARPYRPTKGYGYATVEPIGRDIEEVFPPGTSLRFRVSLRRRPPVWHEDRIIEVAEDFHFDDLKVIVMVSDLQIEPLSPVTMTRTPEGDYIGWFTLTIPIESPSKSYIVHVHFLDDEQPIYSLKFPLKVGQQVGEQV